MKKLSGKEFNKLQVKAVDIPPSPYFKFFTDKRVKNHRYFSTLTGRVIDRWEVWYIVKNDPILKDTVLNGDSLYIMKRKWN